MAEASINLEGTKEEKYQQLIPMIKALVNGETNRIANLANVAAALKQGFDFFWVGFYWVDEDSLILGPFQGPIACTRIAYGKGVCGSVWKSGESLIVPNVNEFPGHIACSSASQSEIVIPLKRNKKVIGVLDVDSDLLDDFDTIDQKYLTELCNWLADNLVL